MTEQPVQPHYDPLVPLPQHLTVFNPIDHLHTPQARAAYLHDLLDPAGSQELFLNAVGELLRSERLTTEASKAAGVSREGLYKSLSKRGNPSFATIQSALRVLGLQLAIQPLDKHEILAPSTDR